MMEIAFWILVCMAIAYVALRQALRYWFPPDRR
jgi:hypothetical protein